MATAKKPATRKTAARKAATTRSRPKAAKSASADAKPKAAKAAKPAKAAKTPKATTKATKAAQPAKTDKVDKARKPKLVRDSFTIPKGEYTVLDDLKLRAARLGRPAKKSEVLRAGLKALAAMADAEFLASVTAVPAVKTGRPAKA